MSEIINYEKQIKNNISSNMKDTKTMKKTANYLEKNKEQLDDLNYQINFVLALILRNYEGDSSAFDFEKMGIPRFNSDKVYDTNNLSGVDKLLIEKFKDTLSSELINARLLCRDIVIDKNFCMNLTEKDNISIINKYFPNDIKITIKNKTKNGKIYIEHNKTLIYVPKNSKRDLSPNYFESYKSSFVCPALSASTNDDCYIYSKLINENTGINNAVNWIISYLLKYSDATDDVKQKMGISLLTSYAIDARSSMEKNKSYVVSLLNSNTVSSMLEKSEIKNKVIPDEIIALAYDIKNNVNTIAIYDSKTGNGKYFNELAIKNSATQFDYVSLYDKRHIHNDVNSLIKKGYSKQK